MIIPIKAKGQVIFASPNVNYDSVVNISRFYFGSVVKYFTLLLTETTGERLSESEHRGPGNVVRGHPPASRQTLPLQTGETKDGGRW